METLTGRNEVGPWERGQPSPLGAVHCLLLTCVSPYVNAADRCIFSGNISANETNVVAHPKRRMNGDIRGFLHTHTTGRRERAMDPLSSVFSATRPRNQMRATPGSLSETGNRIAHHLMMRPKTDSLRSSRRITYRIFTFSVTRCGHRNFFFFFFLNFQQPVHLNISANTHNRLL